VQLALRLPIMSDTWIDGLRNDLAPAFEDGAPGAESVVWNSNEAGALTRDAVVVRDAPRTDPNGQVVGHAIKVVILLQDGDPLPKRLSDTIEIAEEFGGTPAARPIVERDSVAGCVATVWC
jgi:hypothetical protein